jgi:deoxyhypusine synthase
MSSESATRAGVPAAAADAVLVPSTKIPEGAETVRGYNFDHGVNYPELLASFARTGFQATNFGKAVEEINRMVRISSFY